MTPQEFLETVVRPNMADLNADTGDFRAAFNAIASVDALAAHIYEWGISQEPPLIEKVKRDDDGYRELLEDLNADYYLLCELARAFKHVKLRPRKKKPRLVFAAAEISPQTLMVDDMESFDRDWTTGPCVLIDRGDERPLIARNVLERALAFLEGHLEDIAVRRATASLASA